jgi:hypothetical protein
MKKVFVILFASAAFSIGGCKSGSTDNGAMMDSTAAKEMVNEAMDSVKAATDAAMDTAKQTITNAADSAKVK